MLRFVRSLCIAATALVAATCDLDKITTSKTADRVGILGIAGDSLVPLGGFANLSVVDSKGNKPRFAVVQWSTANPSIATVDSVGRVAAVAIGATIITATSRLLELSEPVVNEWSMRVRYASIAIAPITDSITSLGATRTLAVSGRNVAGQSVATLQPSAVAYVSRDSARAAVSSAGVVTARKNGGVTVVASIDAGLLKDSILVKIRQVAARLSFGVLTEFVIPSLGRDYALPVQVFDGRDSVIASPVLAWSATDTSVATVGATTGAVRGKKVDTTTIVVRSDTARKTIKMRVQQVVAAITKSSGDAQSAQVGTTIQVAPAVIIADSGGSAIAGSSVSFAVASGAGTITEANQTTPANGKAAVGSWTLGTTAGTQTLMATSAGVATTFIATGVAGPATHLVFLREPTATPANAAIAPTVQIAIADAYNNVVLTATDSVQIGLASNPGAATLSGTLVAASTNGVATFSDLRLDRTASGYSIVASHGSLGTATSNSFNVFGVPIGLAFAVQPSDVAVTQAINPAMKAAVVDAQGNTVSNVAPTTITLSIGTNAGGGAIAGTITATTQAGVATFGNVSISALGNGYTLRASATGLTQATSSAFNVLAVGALTKLGFIAQPQNRQAGSAFSPALQVAIQDASGTTVTSVSRQITVSLDTNPGSATLAGTLTVATVNGVAVLPGLSLDRVGVAYRLRATADGAPLAAAVSSSFNITPAPASKLQFLVHPTNALIGSVIAPPVQVAIQDAFGNTVASASNAVTLAITTNPGSGSLGGTTTNVAPTNGVATFNNLTVSAQGTGYVVTASGAGLTSAASNPFTIAAIGAAIKLRFIVQPTSVTAGTAISPSLQVAIQDAGGNTVTSASASITLAIANPATGATLSGTATQTTSSGVATFSGINVNVAAATRLVATATNLTTDTSSSFTVSPAAASKLTYVSQPVTTTSGATIPSFSVAIQDAFGNTVSGATSRVDVAIESGSGSLTGTTRATPVNGVATFSDIGIALARTGYQLRALSFDAPLANAVSNSFDIIPGPASKLGFVGSVPSTSVSSTMAQVQVAVQDANGNTVPTASDLVTIAIASGTAGAVLSGTTSATALSGIATYSNLSIDKVGSSYALKASAPDRTSATSNSFAVISSVASVTVSPAGASVSGGTQQFTAVAKDAGGSTIAGTTYTWASLNPNVATINSSTGVASAVASGQVTISATVDGETGYALITCAIPGATPVNLWATMASGTIGDLSSVWGKSKSDVYAGDYLSASLRFNGVSWVSADSTLSLYVTGKLWASSPVDKWKLDNGYLERFDGSSWTVIGALGTIGLWGGVWGFSSRDVYVVSDDNGFGKVFHFDGTAWTNVLTTSSTNQGLNAVWGTSASDVYAVGYNGAAFHFDGVSWTRINGLGFGQYLAIWGSSATDLYVVGALGLVLQNGTVAAPAQTTQALRGVWGTSSADVFAVGTRGTILRGVRGAAVSVTPSSPTLTALGATQQLIATAKDAGNNVISGLTATSYTWTISNTAVATVSSSGLVTAVANGAATITATAAGGAASSTTVTVAAPPAAPTNLTATAVSTSQIDLAWTDNASNEDGFRIERCSGVTCTTFTEIATVGVNVTSYQNTGVIASSYRYRVRAYNVGSNSGYSNSSMVVPFASIGAGDLHSCGLSTGGEILCWGQNYWGQLGDGSRTDRNSPVLVLGSLTFVSLSLGDNSSCALTAAGAAYCWGGNSVGRLGVGSASEFVTAPAPVVGGLVFQSVSNGDQHRCGIVTGGVAYCWGFNGAGQLGKGDTSSTTAPAAVAGGLTFQSISAGHRHTCGVTTGGAAYCWGQNGGGELGNGTTGGSTSPVAVTGGLTFQKVIAAEGHSCGITSAGAAYCWGANAFGQLGNGTTTIGVGNTSPGLVSGGLTYTSGIDATQYHTCALTTGNAGYCWGYGMNGQLGNGTSSHSNVPVPVSGGLTLSASAAGSGHSCGVSTIGRAFCWGANSSGQLGTGANSDSTTPVAVANPQ